MNGRFVSYLRVSTDKQGKSGLGLEAQRQAMLAYLNGGQWTLAAEFIETESGKSNSRPQLAKALEQCRLIGATLVVAKLDRLSRNVAFLANIMEAKVDFLACDNPNATRFTLHILAAVAEHEAAMISARTKAALAAAKARGQVLGGLRAGSPALSPEVGLQARRARAAAYAERVRPTLLALRGEGMSLRQMSTELEVRGVQTPRGGRWTPNAIAALLAGA